MRYPDLRPQRHILPIRVLAHPIDYELLGHQLRDPRPELQLNEIEHEVQRRRPPGAGYTDRGSMVNSWSLMRTRGNSSRSAERFSQ